MGGGGHGGAEIAGRGVEATVSSHGLRYTPPVILHGSGRGGTQLLAFRATFKQINETHQPDHKTNKLFLLLTNTSPSTDPQLQDLTFIMKT